MGTLTGQTIALKIEYVLNDATNVRWTETELLAWINEAQREIAALKPNTSISTVDIALVEGSKQEIAATHIALIDVIRNMGAAGAVPGPGIRPIERAQLDVAFGDWHLAIYAELTVQCFWFDEKDPGTFYVFPTQPSGTTQEIEVKVTVPPTDLASLASTIDLADTWESAILDHVLFRAFAKDTTSAPNRERSGFFYQSFMKSMGIRTGLDPAYAADKDDTSGQNANTAEPRP